MAIVKRHREPNGVRQWRQEVEDMFDNMFALGNWSSGLDDIPTSWVPRTDITESEDHYMVMMDLPGLEKKQIQVTMQDNRLIVSGERREEKKEEKRNRLKSERREGSFYRSFQFPELVNEDKIKAEFKDGVLSVTIPKVEKKKPNVVNVE